MKFLKKAVSVLLAAVTAVTMMFAGNVTAGARKVTKESDGSTITTYDSDDWYVVYYPSTTWVTVKDGAMIASFSKRVLEIHMPDVYYDGGYRQVSEGKIFEIAAGNSDNLFYWQLYPEDYAYAANIYCNGEWHGSKCFEKSRTDKKTVDEYYSERVVKLLLADDCPDSVIRCLESGFKSGDFYLSASYFEDFGEPGTYFLNNEKVSYSVHDNSSSESDSSQVVLKKTTLTAKRSGEKITLSWNKVDGAEKYQIYYREKGESKYKKLATVSGSKTSYSTSKLDKNKTYQFKIRSYAESNGKKVYSKFSKVKTVTAK